MAEERGEGLVPQDAVGDEIPVPDRIVGSPGREAVALLGLMQRRLATAPLQGDPEQVGEALHERDVGLGEPALGRAVRFQDAVAAVRWDDRNVDGPPDAMVRQDLRRAEATSSSKMARDDGLARLEGISGRAFQVRTRPGSDHAGLPAHPGPDDEPVLVRQILHDLAEPGVQPFGAEPGRLLEQAQEIRVSSASGRTQPAVPAGGGGRPVHRPRSPLAGERPMGLPAARRSC